jgi:transcriptional regulator GlxA family with amidase domain
MTYSVGNKSSKIGLKIITMPKLKESMMDIAVLALPRSYMSSIGTLLDAHAIVKQQRQVSQSRVVVLSSIGSSVALADGRQFRCDGNIQEDNQYGLVYIPAFMAISEQAILTMLEQSQPMVDWLRQQYKNGAHLAGSGTAALLLAKTGLLDHGSVAMDKPLLQFFQRKFPRIRANTRSTVVEHEGIFTCRAPTSDWQLIARLMEQAFSLRSAHFLAAAIDIHTDLSENPLGTNDPLVANAQFWLAQRFSDKVKISELAHAMAVSHATLIRRFERCLGMTPKAYAQHLRIESGKHMLKNTTHTIDHIAGSIGYADLRSFRAAFRKNTGQSPSAWRMTAI